MKRTMTLLSKAERSLAQAKKTLNTLEEKNSLGELTSRVQVLLHEHQETSKRLLEDKQALCKVLLTLAHAAGNANYFIKLKFDKNPAWDCNAESLVHLLDQDDFENFCADLLRNIEVGLGHVFQSSLADTEAMKSLAAKTTGILDRFGGNVSP